MKKGYTMFEKITYEGNRKQINLIEKIVKRHVDGLEPVSREGVFEK